MPDGGLPPRVRIGTHPKARKAWRVAAASLLVLLLATMLASCLRADATHAKAVLDALKIPASWSLVHTTVREPGGPDRKVDRTRARDDIDCFEGECPSVTVYYFVSGKPADSYPEARQLLIDGGFTIDQETGPKCDVTPSSPACSLQSTHGGDYVRISLFDPGTDFTGTGISDPNKALIQVVARAK